MEMTRSVLERYCSNEQEIRDMQDRLMKLGAENAEGILSDYTKRQIQRTTNLIRHLQEQNDRAEEFVFSIDDCITRRIFKLYYLDGECQQVIASKLNMERSGVSKKICTHWNSLIH